MKILHVLSSNRYSGAENVVCQIMGMFDGEIEMCYCSPDGDIANTLKEKGIQFLPLKKFSVKEIKRAVEQYKPDIIHAHDLKAIVMVGCISKRYRKVAHIHVNDKEKMSKLSLKSIILKWFSKKYEHLFWVSNSCLQDYKYKSSIQHKSSVLYNIIDTNKLENLVLQDDKEYNYDIVYLGRLTYQKDPIRLIEIAKQLKLIKPNFKMAIVGTGDMFEEVKSAVIDSDLTDNVDCLGFMRNAYKLLSQSKVMIMTSRFEGTPMSALESLALGTPIVSTKTDGMVDLLKDDYNGMLYNNNDEAVKFIVDVIENEDKQRYLTNNCIEFSNKYNDMNDYKNKLKSIYAQGK